METRNFRLQVQSKVIFVVSFIVLHSFLVIGQDAIASESSSIETCDNLVNSTCNHQTKSIIGENGSNLGDELEDSSERFNRDYESTHWRWRYIEEHFYKFRILVHDEFLDNRLANILSTAADSKPANLDSTNFNSGNKVLDYYNEMITAGKQVDDRKCGEHLMIMIDQLKEINEILEEKRGNSSTIRKFQDRHLMLAHILDSYGRYESGQLVGKTNNVGSYKQCMDGLLMLNNSNPEVKTPMRYCSVRFDMDKYLAESIKSTNWPRPVLLSGACVPETCHTKSFRKHKNLLQKIVDTQFKLPKSLYVEENLPIDSVYCAPDPTSDFKIGLPGKLFLTFLATWLALCIMMTWINRGTTGDLNSVADALDLRKSWQSFIAYNDRVADTKVNLNTLSLMKILSSFLILLGHCFFLHGGSPSDVVKFFALFELRMFETGISGLSIFTETFYALSGLLLCYLVLKKTSEQTKQQKQPRPGFFMRCFLFVLGRYLRLIPIYYIIFLFKRTVFIHIGSGPFWDYGFNRLTNSGGCQQETYLTPLLSKAPYLPLAAQCTPTAWSVAGDMLMSMLIAPIVFMMVKRPKLALMLCILLSVSSVYIQHRSTTITSRLLQADLANVRPYIVGLTYRKFSWLYSAVEYHLYSVLTGVLAGYALFRYDISNSTKWPLIFRGPITWMAIIINLVLFILLPLVAWLKSQGLYEYTTENPETNMQYLITGRLVWVACNSIIFLRQVTDWKDTKWGRFSGCRLFQIWSRLLLIFILLQMDLLTYFLDQRLSISPYIRLELYQLTAFALVACTAISIPIYVIFENPSIRLSKVLIWNKLIRSASKQGEDNKEAVKQKRKV